MPSLKLDLHLHTIYSGDSLISPTDAITYAKIKNLSGFAVCDHNTLKAYNQLKKKAKENNLIVIPGMEIETHIGEVIGLFIDKEIDIRDNNFFTIVEKIIESNGLVVIPHPFDFLRSNHLKMSLLSDHIIKKYIHGVEIMNSRIILNRCVKKAKKFNEKYNLFETGGSDAHTKKEIGNGFPLIKDANDESLETIRKSLLENQSRSMGRLSSPFVHLFTVMNKIKKGLYF